MGAAFFIGLDAVSKSSSQINKGIFICGHLRIPIVIGIR
jgi:hypothetical protein